MIKRKLENYHFPEGVKSMFINGKYYSRKKFLEARKNKGAEAANAVVTILKQK